jgi:hypothetical protein
MPEPDPAFHLSEKKERAAVAELPLSLHHERGSDATRLRADRPDRPARAQKNGSSAIIVE